MEEVNSYFRKEIAEKTQGHCEGANNPLQPISCPCAGNPLRSEPSERFPTFTLSSINPVVRSGPCIFNSRDCQELWFSGGGEPCFTGDQGWGTLYATGTIRVWENNNSPTHRRLFMCRPRGYLFRGKKVNPIPPYERNIGMVFQNYALGLT